MPVEPSASATWDQIAARLREMLNAGIYSTWFGQVQPLEQDDDRLVVGVPNAFTKDWIEGHFGSLLDAAASEQEMVVELRVAVSEAMAARAAEPTSPRRTLLPTTPTAWTSRPAPASTRATRSTCS